MGFSSSKARRGSLSVSVTVVFECAPQPYVAWTTRPSAEYMFAHTPKLGMNGTMKAHVLHCSGAAAAMAEFGPNSPVRQRVRASWTAASVRLPKIVETVIIRHRHEVARAEVAGAHALGIGHPLGRLKGVAAGHERDLVDGHVLRARRAREHRLPLPSRITRHVGLKAVRRDVTREPGDANMLADAPFAQLGNGLPRHLHGARAKERVAVGGLSLFA